MTLDEVLAAHVAADGKEAADLAKMREFAARLQRPFSRHQEEAHFTASALILHPSRSSLLLVHHAKLGRWLQPGGHVEEGDRGDLEAAALREAREETSLAVSLLKGVPTPFDVDIHGIPARKGEPAHLHLDVRFLMVAEDADRLAHDPTESHGAAWLTFDEALARADEPAFVRMLQKARTLAKGP